MSNLVSVIIPVHNAEKFIKNTLDSIINQDYESIEIILIDDLSTDCTCEIADDVLKNSRRKFKIIHHEINKGPGGSRNTGIENASGEFLCFVDSDDLLKENFISKLYENILLNDSEISFCGMVDRFTDGRPDKFIHADKHNKIKSNIGNNGEDVLYNEILYSAVPHVCAMMFKKSFLDETEIKFRDKCFVGEDIEFRRKILCRAKKVSFIKECLYIYMHYDKINFKNKYGVHDKNYYYEDYLNTHVRMSEYFMKYAKSEKMKYVIKNYLLPEIAVMKFNLFARKNNLAGFMNLIRDENIKSNLREALKFFMLRVKPEIFFKAFLILNFPGIYFKLRRK